MTAMGAPRLVRLYWTVQLLRPRVFVVGSKHFDSLRNILTGHVLVCHDTRCGCGKVFARHQKRTDHIRKLQTRKSRTDSKDALITGFFKRNKTPKEIQPRFWPWSLSGSTEGASDWLKFLVGGLMLKTKIGNLKTKRKAQIKKVKARKLRQVDESATINLFDE